MGFHPQSLLEQDDAGILAAAVFAWALCVCLYHRQLLKGGPGYMDFTYGDEEEIDEIKSQHGHYQSMEASERNTMNVSEWSRNADHTRRRSSTESLKKDLFTVDICNSSRVGIPSWVLLLFRLLCVASSITFWTEFWLTGHNWGKLISFQAWGFILLTLMYSFGAIGSISYEWGGRSDPYRSGWFRSIFIVLLETSSTTTLLLFTMYWIFFLSSDDYGAMFPSSDKLWVNCVFVSVNLASIVIELTLNRVILQSRRWMYFSYLYLLYLLFAICVEKLFGDGKLLYEHLGFLELTVKSIPVIIFVWMAYFCCHYLTCFFITIKQHLWMEALPSDLELSSPVCETTLPAVTGSDEEQHTVETSEEGSSLTQPLIEH